MLIIRRAKACFQRGQILYLQNRMRHVTYIWNHLGLSGLLLISHTPSHLNQFLNKFFSNEGGVWNYYYYYYYYYHCHHHCCCYYYFQGCTTDVVGAALHDEGCASCFLSPTRLLIQYLSHAYIFSLFLFFPPHFNLKIMFSNFQYTFASHIFPLYCCVSSIVMQDIAAPPHDFPENHSAVCWPAFQLHSVAISLLVYITRLFLCSFLITLAGQIPGQSKWTAALNIDYSPSLL